jgi:hypothetical protein
MAGLHQPPAGIYGHIIYGRPQDLFWGAFKNILMNRRIVVGLHIEHR